MPEEVAIVLIVLALVGWAAFAIVAKVLKEVGLAYSNFLKNWADWEQRRLQKRRKDLTRHVKLHLPTQELEHAEAVVIDAERAVVQRNALTPPQPVRPPIKSKGQLRPYVKIKLPVSQLENADHDLSSLENEINRRSAEAIPKPAPPFWKKVEFSPIQLVPHSNSYTIMNASHLRAILHLNSQAWSTFEGELLKRSCTYPYPPPKVSIRPFSPLSIAPLQLDEAALDFDKAEVSDDEIDRLFSREKQQVANHNQRRTEVLRRHAEVSRLIEMSNTQEREKLERYSHDADTLCRHEMAKYQESARQYSALCGREKNEIANVLEGFKAASRASVIQRIEHILSSLILPSSVPRTWKVDFDEERRILVVDLGLPDVVHQKPIKTVRLKSGPVTKPLNRTEEKAFIPKAHPAILLRVANEILRNDDWGTISLLVVNGWVEFHKPATGILVRTYTASLMVKPAQLKSMNLENVDPVVAFQDLKGKSAGMLIEIVPVEPALHLNTSDSRFVEAKPVLGGLDKSTNLAAMDWQDFEHLVRELFEKEFVGKGAEVKVTQASRDRGVDAIAFNPDPIHGGKFVIQAKRYTNVVDVSAVRDLCAVVRKEGASRGILVTTSSYGPDAYAFANNEPVTLLDGAQLLGLLAKHGYSFKIDLNEAKKVASAFKS